MWFCDDYVDVAIKVWCACVWEFTFFIVVGSVFNIVCVWVVDRSLNHRGILCM